MIIILRYNDRSVRLHPITNWWKTIVFLKCPFQSPLGCDYTTSFTFRTSLSLVLVRSLGHSSSGNIVLVILGFSSDWSYTSGISFLTSLQFPCLLPWFHIFADPDDLFFTRGTSAFSCSPVRWEYCLLSFLIPFFHGVHIYSYSSFLYFGQDFLKLFIQLLVRSQIKM